MELSGAWEGLRALFALVDFVGDIGARGRDGCDNVPNELALGSLNGGTAYAFGAGPARPLWVGRVRIKNDAVSNSFRNFAHVIFDGNRKRAASALDDKFLGAQDGDFPNRGPVGVRANHRGSHMQGESFCIGRGKSGGAARKCGGVAGLILNQGSAAAA